MELYFNVDVEGVTRELHLDGCQIAYIVGYFTWAWNTKSERFPEFFRTIHSLLMAGF